MENWRKGGGKRERVVTWWTVTHENRISRFIRETVSRSSNRETRDH